MSGAAFLALELAMTGILRRPENVMHEYLAASRNWNGRPVIPFNGVPCRLLLYLITTQGVEFI